MPGSRRIDEKCKTRACRSLLSTRVHAAWSRRPCSLRAAERARTAPRTSPGGGAFAACPRHERARPARARRIRPLAEPADLERALAPLQWTGLVIPFAGEGFRKYSQEYTNPWRGTVKLDDRVGRTLGSTAATLHFPWRRTRAKPASSFACTAAPRARSCRCGSTAAPSRTRPSNPAGSNWFLPVPARVLTRGENTLALAAGKKGAVFHSIEIAAGKPAEAQEATWPAASRSRRCRNAGQERDCLTGFPRLMMPIEIPQDGWLVVATAATAGAARFQVSVTARISRPRFCSTKSKSPGARASGVCPWRNSPGKLVALELSIRDGRPADAAWVAPRILLPKAAVQRARSPRAMW
jgi:hypothetical protein